MTTIVMPLVNLSILIGLLIYFLKKPIELFVETRHHTLARRLREAQKMITEAEAQKKELDKKLLNLESERQALRQQLTADAEAAIKNAITKAEKLSADAVVSAKTQAEHLLMDFKRNLIADVGEKIVKRAESVIRQRITGQDTSRMREELSKELIGG